jgi:predicted DNA-binding protein
VYTESKRIITTLSPYLKEKLEQLSNKFGCSQAEVVRMGIMKLWETEG